MKRYEPAQSFDDGDFLRDTEMQELREGKWVKHSDHLADKAADAARIAANNRSTHHIKGHSFEAYEMLWNERCVNCGSCDSMLSDVPCNHSFEIEVLRARIAALEAQVARLEADAKMLEKEREELRGKLVRCELNWEADAKMLDWLDNFIMVFTSTDDRLEFEVPKGSTLRAAITAAMGKEKRRDRHQAIRRAAQVFTPARRQRLSLHRRYPSRDHLGVDRSGARASGTAESGRERCRSEALGRRPRLLHRL